MKRFMPLIVSACIAVTLTYLIVQMENVSDPVPASYPWEQDLPFLIVLAGVFTCLFFGLFLLGNLIIKQIVNKNPQIL
jgi:predicted PurR-regulated permease PerM